MKKIIEALKVSARIMAIVVAIVSAIWFLSYFIIDHFGLIAAYVFFAVVLFGVIFLAVWTSSKDSKDGEQG